MSVQRAWEAWMTDGDYTARTLVFATCAHEAAERYLRRVHRYRRKAARLDLIASARAGADPARSWAVFPERSPDCRRHVFARSMEAAREAGSERFGAEVVCAGCDPLHALVEMTFLDLEELVFYVWADNRKSAKRDQWVPYVRMRMVRGVRKADIDAGVQPKVRRTTHLQIAMALRLSMSVPSINSERSQNYALPGSVTTRAADRIRRRHGGNVRPDIIGRMRERFGEKFSAMDHSDIELLGELVSQYGEDPQTIRLTEAIALWNEGPRGLERRRLDGELGLLDRLSQQGVVVDHDSP